MYFQPQYFMAKRASQFNNQLHNGLLSNFSPLLLPEPINGTISITLCSRETAEGECGELVGVDSIRAQVPHIDLHGGMILRCNEPICGRALPGDVKIHILTLLVLHLE